MSESAIKIGVHRGLKNFLWHWDLSMNTDRLIQVLSSEASNDRGWSLRPRLLIALALGASTSFLMMLFALGIQPNLIEKMALPLFWTKFSFALTLLGIGLIIATISSRPGKAASKYRLLFMLPIAGIWLIALQSIGDSNLASLSQMVQGDTWKVCSLLIVYLSVPIFIATFWAIKEMAPTKPALTGFMTGLFSGGLAACIYCLHCPELSPVFVAIWYLLGTMIPAIVGAILGRKILSW